uniref:Integrase catalytic domain-containing protein n=1 Tax=Trichogramma kaykai TaxID=54128 RepID=A0ABD2WAC2_9HYME
MSALLSSGGFTLAKWMTNDEEMLHSFDADSLAKEATLKVGLGFSVLGLVWEPKTDVFRFNVSLTAATSPVTKRKVLSCIAGLFDPSGWIAPVLISLKIFMQSLWLVTKEWDTPLPDSEIERWREFEQDLKDLPSIAIPRWIGFTNDSYVELHGFADASKFAYAAVIYVRLVSQGEVRVSLLTAKTKVAPIKTLSIPRLELCAAHLLAKLAASVASAEEYVDVPLHLWSDSKTTLHWIHGLPARWPVVVANRCADVINLAPKARWHYVNTKHNPADVASRGCSVPALREDKLWWLGPEALVESAQPWSFEKDEFLLGESDSAGSVTLIQSDVVSEDCEIITRFSSYTRLRRVMVYLLRFVTKLAARRNVQLSLSFEPATDESISVSELDAAALQLCRMTQIALFSTEINCVESGKAFGHRHGLRNLCPMLKGGLLRVGGRLDNSQLQYDCKHQIILPEKSKLVELLTDHLHKVTLHGGARLIIAHLRQRYWIHKSAAVVGARLRRCVVCLCYRSATVSQRMSDLPAVRVTPARLFENSGVDYAGPFRLKASNHRGNWSYKGYMAIFVCMSTKAVHLEAVSAYDTKSFIAAFRRFTARRGPCRHLYSDQGTNFVGADAELRRLHAKSSEFYKSVITILSDQFETTWHFNPPGSPHFGGLWESGVKSVKHHLKRMIGDAMLTYEEFSTLLTQIEAVLNSRPLTPLPSAPEPESVLSPAHLIIGEPSFIVAEPPLTRENVSTLERWKRITQFTQLFWERWSKEYLQTLQKRCKWQLPKRNLAVGDIVLVKDELTPCARWPLAKIIEVHLGRDGLVRVATIATARGSYKRPVVKLIGLLEQ